jgi:two-component system sensor histidine kinase YesM
VSLKLKKIIDRFNSLKFRTKLTILLGIVGLVPIVLLGTIISINAHNTVMSNRKTDMKNSLSQATSSVVSQVAVCEQMMDYFVYEQNVINFIECDPQDKVDRYGYYQEVCNTINALQFQNLIMRKVTIYSENIFHSFGDKAQPLSALWDQPWYADIDQTSHEKYTWIYDSQNLNMLAIREMPNYKGIQSYLVVTCNIQSLLRPLNQLMVDNYGVHVSGSEEVWNFYNDKNTAYNARNESEYICVEQKIQSLGFNVLYYTPRSVLRPVSRETVAHIFIGILICIVIISLMGTLFSYYISKPLELMTQDIQKVDSENMQVSITSKREDEIGILIKSYNHMMQRIQDLIQENYETKIAQKEFEMKALQAQINPHFLYNSLSLINWKAIEANEKEISRIVLSLTSFYRTTLNRGQTMNTIKNEVENIKSYLAIQLCMHSDNFVVHMDVDESVNECSIPSLILQPFVENALEHGLDVKEDPDHQIWISIKQSNADILITIGDNGVGMSSEEVKNILEYDAKGYGVKNVNQRLILHYGPEYHIMVESVPYIKTIIQLRVPNNAKGDDKHVQIQGV